MKKLLNFLAVSALLVSSAFAWTKSGTVYTTTGAQSDVASAVADATAGDTVNIPAGTFSGWGAGGTGITVNKAITIAGAGEASTTIALSATGPYFGSGVINITAAAKVGGFTVTGIINTSGGPSTTAITCVGTGWRVHHITYNGPSAAGYFAYCSGSEGLFDHMTINSNNGSLQTFMIRGATALWNSPHTMGTVHAVYVEDTTYNGPGYANENDGAAASVFRFNTVTGDAYYDAHQFETSSDASGVQHGSRQIEVYHNTQTTAAYVDWSEFSCGTGMAFDNSVAAGVGRWQIVQAYGAHSAVPINGSTPPYQDPNHIAPDGIGMGPYVGGNQTRGAEPFYMFNNTRTDGTDMALQGSSVGSHAISQYGSTFYMSSADGSPYMLLKGRDYLNGLAHGTFPSTSDVGRGTKAQMLASSPTAARQGWWVTDEGNWNTTVAANTSGQLYQWNGSAWVLYYTPYTYPHPLQSGGGGGGGGDTTPPTPNPATLSGAPTHTDNSISVVATMATDETALASQPYSFSDNDGSSWSADQSGTAFTWTGLTASTAYKIKVRYKDAAGNISTQATATTVTTDATPPPSAPVARLRRASSFGN